MKYCSTNNALHTVSLREAVLSGLPPDNGLYMPARIPRLSADLIQALPGMSLPAMALELCRPFVGEEVPQAVLRKIVDETLNFPVPLVAVDARCRALELFHGPTLAFKDFGARFMARLLGHFVAEAEAGTKGSSGKRQLTILVATSGDTGSAVAHGFHNVPGIDVVILYPDGKVSPAQEYQLTSLTGNIQAIRLAGSFDDCQGLVKRAFLDKDLQACRPLSSANSINFARLLPQSFYYFFAWSRLPAAERESTLFSVPSGNFGNLTAGLLSKFMGLPLAGFVAANNRNNVFEEYLRCGQYRARPSVRTVSNAMDVGDPSNFRRMAALYEGRVERMREDISAWWFDDRQTAEAIQKVDQGCGYVLDPHGAVAWLALQAALQDRPGLTGVFLETAHPAKFSETVEPAIGRCLEIPAALKPDSAYVNRAVPLPNEYEAFKGFLLSGRSRP